MIDLKCHSIKRSLLEYLAGATAVEQVGDSCVATLPIPTVDGRLVDVFIESRMGDYFLVHDGGKALNELILQGVKITPSITEHFEALAARFRVSYAGEMFKMSGKPAEVQSMILAVGMCSGLAVGQLVGHVATLVEEPLREQFGHALRGWARKRFKISGDVTVQGGNYQHKFDFVAYPKKSQEEAIAMTVLAPGSNPLGTAQRFGFKVLDLQSTPYAKWRRVAVEGRAEQWTPEAKTLIRRFADTVIEIPQDSKIDSNLVRENLDLMAVA
jgi:hypothetical protein